MDTNKGLCPRNCRLVSALICPEMQGNKKPIFFYESHHKATDYQKKGPTKLCLKSGAVKYKKVENDKKKKQQKTTTTRQGGPAFLETSDNRTTIKKIITT